MKNSMKFLGAFAMFLFFVSNLSFVNAQNEFIRPASNELKKLAVPSDNFPSDNLQELERQVAQLKNKVLKTTAEYNSLKGGSDDRAISYAKKAMLDAEKKLNRAEELINSHDFSAVALHSDEVVSKDAKVNNDIDFKVQKPMPFDLTSNQVSPVESGRPGSSIELIGKRTEFSKTMKNADGSFSKLQSSYPVHYKENNKWVPINTQIEQSELSSYAYSNLTNTLKTYFPENLNDGFLTGITNNQVQDMMSGSFYSSDGESVFSFNNSIPSFNADLNTLSYSLSTDFRLDVKVNNAERKVDYIIENPDFLNQFSGEFFILEEQMKLPLGWKLQEQNGRIGIINEKNLKVASIGEIVYYDANESKENNAGFQITQYEFELLENGNYILKVKIDLSWLTDPQRQFPIVIDPTISASDNSTYNGNSYWVDNGTNNRQVTTSGALASSTITSVDLTVTNEVSYYGGSCNSWWTYQITSAGANVVSGCNGSSFPTTFDGENPNQTWTVTAIDMDGYNDYLGYRFTITVNYDEPATNFAPDPDFSANDVTPSLNTVVTFTDASTYTPTGWAWTFSPNTVTYQTGSSTSQSPSVKFTAAGTYTVTLTATNAYGTVAEVKTGYITVNNYVSITNGGTDSYTGCSFDVYDDAGPSANYTSGYSGTVVLYPSTAGSFINLSGTVVTDQSSQTVFRIYDGTSTSATLIGEYLNANATIDLTASNTDGALTVYQLSVGAVAEGMDLVVTCVSPCSGTPTGGTASITYPDRCSATTVVGTASGFETGTGGLSYLWEYNNPNVGSQYYSAGASVSSVNFGSAFNGYNIRYKTTCSNSGLSSYTNVVNVTKAIVTSGGNVSQCDAGSAALSASVNVGSVEWYAASSGGTALSTGDSYSPSISTTTTYYAAASDCPADRTAITATVNTSPSPTAASSAAGVCSGGTVDLTSTSSASAVYSLTTSGGSYASEKWVNITTGADGAGTVAWAQGDGTLGNGAGLLTAQSIDLSAYAGQTLYLNAYDKWGDSWDGSIYTLSLGGVTVINNSGNSPSGGGGFNSSTWVAADDLETSESFTVPSGTSFAWASDVGGYTSSSQNPTGVSPAANTTYTVTETDGNSCTGTSTVAVTYDEPAAIASTVDGSSVSSGASFRLDQNIGWTSSNSSGIGFIWDADEASPYSNYSWAWTSPATWSDNAGSYLNGGDSRTLYLRARNVNNVTCYSDAVTAVLRKPLVSTSGTLSSFANCEGTAATEQSFTVTGQYLTNDLTVSAPTGFEVSASSGSGYASSITLTPTDGSVSATVYVQIPTTTSSGSPSGDITCASVHNLNGSSTSASATVSATGTVTAVPTITSSTGATICAAGTAGLAATSSAGTINWYTAATGGSSQGTGTSFTTPSISATTIYYVDATDGSCTTGSRTEVTATVNSAPDAGTLTVDLTEALSTQTINWTNSGVSNGTRAYWYQWNDDNTTAPTGTWTDFGASTEAHSWGAGSAGSNMNRTLWVKTIVTTDQGCPGSPAESTPVYTDVVNCKAGTTSASVSAGTVANMPFGETITYTSGTPGDGSFERFQYQWEGTSGSWTDWSTSNPNAYTTDINAGQTLYVRSKIVGASVSGSATCTDYSNNIQTFLVDCANSVAASAGSDEDLCLGSSVALSGSGSGSNVSSYSWSPNTEISSTSSATPTISATSTRTYTLTTTHDNGCTSTDDIIVTVTDVPTITTATDLTTVANTCGVTELSISHSGTGGNGAWTSSGGTVAFTSGSSTDASISVRPIPADVNTDITMIWTVDGGEACDGAITTKVIRFNQPTAISSPDTYCYLWGGLTSTDITTGDNWYKWNASTGVDMWERQSSPPGASTDKLHVLTTDNNCIHATNTPIYASSVVANSLNVTSGTDITISSGTLNISGDIDVDGTVTIASGAVLDADGDFDATGGNLTFSGAGTLQVSSSTTSLGTLTTTAGTVKYDGSSAQTVFAGDYYNLDIDGSGTKSLAGNTTVNGDVTLTDGELDIAGGKNLNLIGDMTKTNGALVNNGANNGYLILKATSSQNASQALCGFTAPSVSIKVQQSADVEITGDISANYLWVQSNNSGTFTIDNDYDLTVDQYIKVAGGTLKVVTGSLTTTQNTSTNHELTGGTLDIDGGTVSFGSASDNTTDLNIDGGTLDISGGTLNVSDCIDIETGTFTQSGGIVNVKTNTSVNGDSDHKFDMDAGTLNLTGGTMNLLGEVNNASKYSMSVAPGVTTTSTSGHTIAVSTNDASGDEDRYIDMGDASNDIGNLTFDLAGHDLTFITNTDILGNLTATNGDIDVSSLTVNVAGNAEFTNDDLKISTGILDVEGTFNSPNNTTFSDAGRLQLSGTVSDLGTMTNSVGTVEYDGGAQDIFQDTYFNLEIDGSGIKTLPTGNITVNGDLSLTEGSLNYNTGSSSKFITLKGSVLGTGTITASTTSIFSISGDGTNQDIRGISSDDIGIRLANSSNATTSGDITCKYLDLLSGSTGTFTIDGETVTINPTGGYLEMDGGDLTVSSGSLIINSTSETTNELDAGTLTVSGGTVTFTGNSSSNTGGDLNVDGGTLTVSSGSISINDELDVGSGTINQTGGAIYVDAATNNSSGSSANKFDMVAGSLNLSGGTLYAQSQASSSYNCINIASGVSASIGSSHTFDIGTNSTAKNMYFNFGGHSIGNLTVNLPAKNAYLSEDLNIQGNVNIIDGTLVVDTHNPSVAGSTTVAGTLKIGAGSYDANGTFDASTGTIDFNNGNGQLYVSNSTVTSFGSLDDATGTVVYDGTSAQTIDEAETFYSLKVDNSSGVTLNEAVGVNGTLNMTSGNIVNPSNVLTVGSSAGAGSISHTSGIVTGKLRQYFANATGSKLFPIGNSTIMRDVTVDFTSAPGANQYLTASYNAGHPQANDGSDLYEGLPLTTADGQLIQNYDDDGYWEIIPGSSSTGDSYSASINAKAYNVSLHCNDLTGADNVTNMDRTKVRVIKSAGPGHTSWEALTHVSVSGTDADFTLTGSGTGFSFFGAGTDDDNALPVELVSFNGSCNDGVVDLIWQTASENNSEDFEVAYSRDGIDWDLIHTEPAAGFSTDLISYTYEHKQAISGDNYYRLTQNDIDGASVIYDNLIINASCQSTSNGYFSIFPNPSSGSFQVVMNNPEIEGAANLNITDTKGNKVFTKKIVVNSGINMYVIQQELAPGIYYINVENGARTTTIVKHSIR